MTSEAPSDQKAPEFVLWTDDEPRASGQASSFGRDGAELPGKPLVRATVLGVGWLVGLEIGIKESSCHIGIDFWLMFGFGCG